MYSNGNNLSLRAAYVSYSAKSRPLQVFAIGPACQFGLSAEGIHQEQLDVFVVIIGAVLTAPTLL